MSSSTSSALASSQTKQTSNESKIDITYTNKFTCSLTDLSDTLEKYGVAIVKDVLDEKECKSLRDLAWSEFEGLTENRLDRKDESTYREIYELFPLHSMLIQYFNVGHMQWVWNIRQHAKVKEVFSTIHETNDLLVSFDGVSFHMPPEITNKGWYRGNKWFHTDQGTKHDELCVQGLVNLYPVNVGDATLAVFEGSHRYHSDFFNHFKKDASKDWYKLANKDEYDFFSGRGCNPIALTAPEGSMFLWNSKTFHQGIEADRKREKPNFRLVSYVCMTPREWATKENLNKRVKALKDLRVTSHWPHRVKLFSSKPRTYGKDLPSVKKMNIPDLNEEGLSLI